MDINQTLDLVKKAQNAPIPDEIRKGFTQSSSATSGLTEYDLEAPAKTLYPVLTPIRNMLPRVSGRGGIQANWRAITGVNTTNIRPGVSEGNRGGVIPHTTADYIAVYRGFGLEDYVTFEAEYAGEGFDDVRARAVEGLLRAAMIAEEGVILGGNTSLALGATPTPTLVTSSTGGTIAAGTYNVACVALAFDAAWALLGWNNGVTGQSLSIATASVSAIASIVRTNADGSSDTFGGGVGQKSATASTGALTGATNSLTATVAPVTGAFAYAWYFGTAGSEKLAAITTINSVSITAAAAGADTLAALPAGDNSTCGLEYDGLLTFAAKGLGGYYAAQATGTPGTGTPLTSDSAGGITEIDAMLADRWNKYRLGFDFLFVNAQEVLNITKKIIAGGAAPLYRFALDAQRMQDVEQGQVQAGVVIGSYLNKFLQQKVRVVVHPNMPPGTILGFAREVPYKLSGVQNVAQVRLRRDYYQVEWPRKSRKYEYGIYHDGVLQHYFPPALGVITNIANG